MHSFHHEHDQQQQQNETSSSKIVNFYKNRSILITGGSGFIGKVLIEKLLRTCPDLKHIFVLIRPKWSKQPQERLEELLKAPLFDLVRANRGLMSKLSVVEGDVTQTNLGLSDQNLLRIMNEVSVIYHSAATIKFDEPLKQSIAINITGTKNMIELCRKIPQLASLVHVSTAYANCDIPEVDEHVYPVLGNDRSNKTNEEIDPEKLIDLSTWLDQETLQKLKVHLLNKRPNTYTYTKALAEWLLVKCARDLPVVICRPSIVVASWKEPFEGWIDNVNGPTGIILGAGKGLVRSMFAEKKSVADLIPVDTVISMMITLGWFANVYHKNYKQSISDVAESLTELSMSTSSASSVIDSDDVSTGNENSNNNNNNNSYNDNENGNIYQPSSSSSRKTNSFSPLSSPINTSRNNKDLYKLSVDDGYKSSDCLSLSSNLLTAPSATIAQHSSKKLADLTRNVATTVAQDNENIKHAAFEYKLKQFRHNTRLKLISKNLPEHLADVPVFHCTSGQLKPITWGQVQVLVLSYLAFYPSISAYRYPCGSFTTNKYLDDFYRVTLHYIPGYFVDFLTKLMGGKPVLVRIYQKFDSAANVLKAFTSREWKFNNDNSQMLINEIMIEEDKKIFNCDVRGLDWNAYLRGYVFGVRKYLLKESDDSLEEARINLKVVYYRNLGLQTIFFLSFMYYFLNSSLFVF